MLSFGPRMHLMNGGILGLWYTKIYSKFVWEQKDHWGTYWYVGFVCVTNYKKGWYYVATNQGI